MAILMVVYKILKSCRTSLVTLITYCSKSFFTLAEVVNVCLTIAIISCTLSVMVSEEFSVNEDGTTDGLIEQLYKLIHYEEQIRLFFSALVFLSIVSLFKYFGFSVYAMVPINAIYKSRYDFVNMTIIYLLFLGA